jgi:hypothetical protein
MSFCFESMVFITASLKFLTREEHPTWITFETKSFSGFYLEFLCGYGS